MPLTVAETMYRLECLKHTRAIWQQTVEHLSKFVDKEVRPAEHGIKAEDCVVNPVPQEAVKEFIDIIEETEIEPLNQEIAALENLSVEETNEDPGDDGEKAKAGKEEKRKTSSSPAAAGGKKSSSGKAIPPKRLRSIPKHPRRKAQGTG